MGRSGKLNRQLTAFFASTPNLASSEAVNSFSAKATGQFLAEGGCPANPRTGQPARGGARKPVVMSSPHSASVPLWNGDTGPESHSGGFRRRSDKCPDFRERMARVKAAKRRRRRVALTRAIAPTQSIAGASVATSPERVRSELKDVDHAGIK